MAHFKVTSCQAVGTTTNPETTDNITDRRGDILIVRNDHLGDAVLALPAVLHIKNRFPERRVHFLAHSSVAPLISCVEGVSSVVSSDEGDMFAPASPLKQLAVETAVCLRPTLANALLLKRAGIPVRIGSGRRWYSSLFNRRVDISRRKSDEHEVDLNHKLMRGLGIEGRPEFPSINIPESARAKAMSILSEHHIDTNDRFIVIHPGSGGSASEWRPDNFRMVADMAVDRLGLKAAVTGVESERHKCGVAAAGRHLNLCGATGLLELAAIIDRAEILIAASTGPLHLKVALGGKVLGLYPPKPGSLPARWGPYGHPEWALTANLPPCRKCQRGDYSSCRCMEAITPDQVFDKAAQILNEGC